MRSRNRRQRRGLGLAAALIVTLTALLVASGCGPVRTGGTLSVASPDFLGLGDRLAVQLTSNLRHRMGQGGRLLMTTCVAIDDLYQTSRFGRTLTEAVATQLFRHGFEVVEARKAPALMVKADSGELMLSRDSALLADAHTVDGVVVGTYSLTPQSVIVNLRLLDASSDAVLSVAAMEIQRSRAIDHLLFAEAGPGAGGQLSAYER